MAKRVRSNAELPIVIFAIVIILVVLAGFLVLKITGRIVYGEPLSAQLTDGTMTYTPLAPTPSQPITLEATVSVIGFPTVIAEVYVDGLLVNTCMGLFLGESCVYGYPGGFFGDGTTHSYYADFTDALLHTYTTPLGSFTVASVCPDGTCDGTEDLLTCPSDCSVCGDGMCTGPENDISCYDDCGSCGDGTCQIANEDCASCETDCGACVVCGDLICDPTEDCSTCSTDCGACSTGGSSSGGGGGGGGAAFSVIRVSPEGGSSVSNFRNLQIIVGFSKGMNTKTINSETITLTNPAGKPVPFVVSYDAAAHTANLVPSVALAPNTAYTVTITTRVKDSAGRAMSKDYTWQFVTVGAEGSGGAKTGALELVEREQPARGSLKVVKETPASATISLFSSSIINLLNALCGNGIHNVFLEAVCNSAGAASNQGDTPPETVTVDESSEFERKGGAALPGSTSAGGESKLS